MSNPLDPYSKSVALRCIEIMKEVIRDKRNRINSERGFADAIGTTASSINRWKKGTGSPTHSNIKVICEKFGYTPNDIFPGKWIDNSNVRAKIYLEKLMAIDKIISSK